MAEQDLEQPITENSETPDTKSEISSVDVGKAFFAGYNPKNGNPESKKSFQHLLTDYLKQEVEKHPCAKKYNLLVLFDNTKMVKSDSDRIYKAIKTFENEKPLLLVLVSGGGEPGSAYLIGKLCREFSNKKFVVVVPRHAKSAATLLACAANEIHMGSLSELGPIDPQINKMPALGLKNSIEHIAELVSKMPGSAEMFARYLSRNVEPIQIGYYERAAESAKQYAKILLDGHSQNLPENIAHSLVYDYKDHGFVIDKVEATTIFGTDVIKNNTPEYLLGNQVYNTLSDIERFAGILNYSFYFIGLIDSAAELFKNKD